MYGTNPLNHEASSAEQRPVGRSVRFDDHIVLLIDSLKKSQFLGPGLNKISNKGPNK